MRGIRVKQLPKRARPVRSEAEKALQRAKRAASMAKQQEVVTRLLRALYLWRGRYGEGVPVLGLVREYPFFGLYKESHPWKFDLADPNRKIAIEIDGGSWAGKPCAACGQRPGGRHSRGAREKEREKYNNAAACGWRVLSFSTTALERNLPDVVKLIAETFTT